MSGIESSCVIRIKKTARRKSGEACTANQFLCPLSADHLQKAGLGLRLTNLP